jgi:hypothetical protein
MTLNIMTNSITLKKSKHFAIITPQHSAYSVSWHAEYCVFYCYAECHYAECHYVKCHFAECHGTMSMCVWVGWYSLKHLTINSSVLTIKNLTLLHYRSHFITV